MRLKHTDQTYDLVVVGGGITGAGVFSRAVALGYKVLLTEQQDFAWGTSSRSSKMVHGGLRYLKQGRLLLTRASVRERERLLATYPGLVTPLTFLLPVYQGRGPSKLAMTAGLNLYSFLAGQRQHRVFNRDEALARVPGLNPAALAAAFGFKDAQVDDARLVLRILFDAVDRGGQALNYTQALGVMRNQQGQVRAVRLRDRESGLERQVRTRAVINATGPFAEALHPLPSSRSHLRPLRGSHLVFPGHLLSLDRVVSFLHPRDRRPVFLFPWQGALILGTTDVDHHGTLTREPGITRAEADYLVDGAQTVFPGQGLVMENAVSAIAGIRPVLGRGRKSASGESREHAIWKDKGLVTVTGGKLTTFDLLAKAALKAAGPWLPSPENQVLAARFEADAPGPPMPDHDPWLQGRLGQRFSDLADLMTPENRRQIPGTRTCWAELSYGAGHEQVRHLSDLLLRRVRIGLLLPRGGLEVLEDIRFHAGPFLDWDDERWQEEIAAYRTLWRKAHAPEGDSP
jgi:glycerol-3-phosphate dehydrogenase